MFEKLMIILYLEVFWKSKSSVGLREGIYINIRIILYFDFRKYFRNR